MITILKPYILTFIPLFIAIDALGNIPLFLALTGHLNKKQKRQVIKESVVTATLLAFFFMVAGKAILRFLGINISDFQIAGGILLLVISTNLLLSGKSKSSLLASGASDVGIFPLGTPLITGPAVLTMTLMMLDVYGPVPTLVSLLVNMVIVWLSFRYADITTHLFGEAGMKAFAKIVYILLAAIAVMFIRKGIQGYLL